MQGPSFKRAVVQTVAAALAFATAAASYAANPVSTGARPATPDEAALHDIVDSTIRPLMTRLDVPGMAVAISIGRYATVFDYGVASVQGGKPVTHDTLFELGSTTKTLTATLASYADVTGQLSLSAPVSRYLPMYADTAFGNVPLRDLGTHTPGGLPLQVPDGIRDVAQLQDYLRRWQPAYAPGTFRTYSNVGIGMLGEATAAALQGEFTALMQERLMPALGLNATYLTVPPSQMANYAQGYTKTNRPIRVKPGLLSAPAYGGRSTASDMIRFVQLNMGVFDLDRDWARAIAATHTGYAKVGPMTQDLIWEQYAYPASLPALLAGNAPAMVLTPRQVAPLRPPLAPRGDVWINKTGSTNGFGSYLAFIPDRQIGIVMLANKNIPIAERVQAAYTIVQALAERAP